MILSKRRLVVLIAILLLLLSACGNSGDSGSKQTQSPADPLAAATDEFNSAVQNLSDAQANLSADIPEAESLLRHTTAKEVTDETVLENLRIVLEKAKESAAITAPEMKSEAEEIQAQAQDIAQQAEDIYSLFYDIGSAISSVKTSKQDLINAKLADSVTAKEVYVGKTSIPTGYEAEFTVSMTNWIKASNTEMVQQAWERVSLEGDDMPSISSFSSKFGLGKLTNDGFTEANAAVLFGTLYLRNITQGFDITEASSPEFFINFTPVGCPSDTIPGMYINITNGHYSFLVRPIMKKNSWGPVGFMIVYPNAITPKDPNGAVLDGITFYINGDEDNPIKVSTSW